MGGAVIFRSVALALGQIWDPQFRRVLLLGLGLTLALFAIFGAGGLWLLGWALPDSASLPLIGEVGWLDDIGLVAGALVLLGASVFLMVPVATAFTGLFLDQVADAVEARHYPHAGPARHIRLSEQIQDALGFLALLLGVNALALLAYVFLAPFAPFIFWGVNGYLLGREYFQMVAMRRMDRASARALRRRRGLSIWLAGTLMAVPLTVPLLNLVVPVLGVAAFTHLFHLGSPGATVRSGS